METTQTELSGTKAVTDPLLKKWSWGAFILDPFFVLAVRKYLYLFLYLLYLVPLINFIAIFGIKIFLGMKGVDMVKESTAFTNDDERRGFLKAVNHAGFIIFIVMLVFFALGFALVSVADLKFLDPLFYGR